MDARLAAPRMLSATSRRKAVLQAAASSKVSGGTRRVLVRPGAEALAITAIPQAGIEARSLGRTVVRISSQTSRPIRRCSTRLLAQRPDKRKRFPPSDQSFERAERDVASI